MKFLRNKQLRQLGAYLVFLACIVFIAEYFFVDWRIARVEEAELKIEYTQLTQLNNQRISSQVQDFLQGNRTSAPQIAALIEQQDFHLKTLKSGGRMQQRNAFIEPLSRLPRVTFDGLEESWGDYKRSILVLVTRVDETPMELAPMSDSTDSGSTIYVTTVGSSETSLARLQYEGLSLTMSHWFDKLIEDLDNEVVSRKSALSLTKGAVLLLNILLVGGAYFMFVTRVLKPITTIKDNVASLQKMDDIPADELGALAQEINHTIEHLKDATDFVGAIGKGEFNLDYKEVFDHGYEAGKNKLADSLIEMQKQLRAINEEEQKRKWANEGLTRFVDILRSSHDNINALGDKIISGLIQYTRSNQGALYVLNDEEGKDRHLELVSIFAWDIKKHEQQRIKPGQGLLGQAFLEKETTYLTSLPDEYIRITSGLGDARPKAVLIVPLKVDQEVYGLVELASFNEFEPHEISFVEKLGESIASTIASVRGAHKNKMLIEQFQEQTEQMRAQEEEMRQNMEELQATQEEIVRKEKDYVARIQELEALQERKAEPEELLAMREKLRQLEDEYQKRIDHLEKELESKSEGAQHWEVAEEFHQQMRIHLDALKITKEALDRRGKH